MEKKIDMNKLRELYFCAHQYLHRKEVLNQDMENFIMGLENGFIEVQRDLFNQLELKSKDILIFFPKKEKNSIVSFLSSLDFLIYNYDDYTYTRFNYFKHGIQYVFNENILTKQTMIDGFMAIEILDCYELNYEPVLCIDVFNNITLSIQNKKFETITKEDVLKCIESISVEKDA